MKLLFLDINLKYLNPTRTLVPAMLRECAESVFYGPGYQSQHILEEGIKVFCENNGPFDFVIGNEFTALPFKNEMDNESRYKNHNFNFNRESLQAMRDIRNWFANYEGRKLALLLEIDGFNLSKDQLASLQEVSGWYGVLWDRRLMESVNDSYDLDYESYAGQANDNYFDFIAQNDKRIIAFPHFVADIEFSWGCLNERKSVWNVPGVSYYYRKLARNILGEKGLVRKQFPWMKTYTLLSRIGLKPFSNDLLLSLYTTQFSRMIEGSKYCYTCGSAQRMHIRKHFEIPAKGTVLVTAPVNGLTSLGFKDGVNCFVRMPHELLELNKELESNPEKAQSIALAGRDLIWSTHRVTSRGKQLRECLESIQKDEFSGCNWENGNWHIHTQ